MQDIIMEYHEIPGRVEGKRETSRVLEKRLQQAIRDGLRNIVVEAHGQHGIGGRLWSAGEDPVHIKINGSPGQRLGSMGFSNTVVEVFGPASDDTGWLNAGAEIIVHGNAGNGTANAMAKGKIYIAGSIGARGMTMTKQNPRFEHPELWVLGSAGDYFGEFMAGGVAVICGVKPQDAGNVLGYRPLVGMVGGQVFYRGEQKCGFSKNDAYEVPLSDVRWEWFVNHLKRFLAKIEREDLYETLTRRSEWHLLEALPPVMRQKAPRRSMSDFRQKVWDAELGPGGAVGDLTTEDRSPIPLIVTGDLRRNVPEWQDGMFSSPCQDACPTGIPVQRRWQLVRDGKLQEAMDLALGYSPFPASVCGYLCPHLCMDACTRQSNLMNPIDVTVLGKISDEAQLPELPEISGKKVAIIGGGPAGLSVAWQMRLQGHDVTVYDDGEDLGGKLKALIPNSRMPLEVLTREIQRMRGVIPHKFDGLLSAPEIELLQKHNDAVIVATGAQKPRMLPVDGVEKALSYREFLQKARTVGFNPGAKVLVIGAGNVGCDVATEAYRIGAQEVLLIDVQEPASFGKEREDAEACGAKFQWPCFTKAITAGGVELNDGTMIAADTVVISIGDVPDLSFMPAEIATFKGHLKVDENFETSVKGLYAVGDVTKPGLLTDAIGMGRKAAARIGARLNNSADVPEDLPVIDKDRVSVKYFNPRLIKIQDTSECGNNCASCGNCRDCGTCEAICPQAAISRVDLPGGGYEYVSDDTRCIGCGFCANACPGGIWFLKAA